MALWHERDISHSSVERVIMPDSTIIMDYTLHRLTDLLESLRIIPENIERNLMSSYGLFFSQRVLMALLENEESSLSRQEAYTLVQRCAMQSWESREYFPSVVRSDPEVTALLDTKALDELFNINYYLRYEDDIFARVFV
jgi:adenylosuccinate lyase